MTISSKSGGCTMYSARSFRGRAEIAAATIMGAIKYIVPNLLRLPTCEGQQVSRMRAAVNIESVFPATPVHGTMSDPLAASTFCEKCCVAQATVEKRARLPCLYRCPPVCLYRAGVAAG